MVIDMKQFELDRLVNMLRSFEWAVTSSSFPENRVVAQMEKVVPGMAEDRKRFEMDRVTNMLKSFGWSVTTSTIGADRVTVSLEKIVTEKAG